MESWHIIITAIASVIAAIVGGVGIAPMFATYLANKRQVGLDAGEGYEKMYARMEARIVAVELAEKDCLKAKEQMGQELGELRAEVRTLRERVNHYDREPVVATIQCNSLGVITEWDDHAETLFGFSRSSMLGKSIETIMPAYERPAHRAAFEEAVKAGADFREKRLRDSFAILHKRGHVPIKIVLNSWEQNGERFFEAAIRELKQFDE